MAENFLEKAIKEMDSLENEINGGNYEGINNHLTVTAKYLNEAKRKGQDVTSARTRYDGLQEITTELEQLRTLLI